MWTIPHSDKVSKDCFPTQTVRNRNILRKWLPRRSFFGDILEEVLISVWQQVLVENVRIVNLENTSFPVRRTIRSRLREFDFKFESHELRGLEQNSKTGSRWANLAREGKKVMQFLQQRRYIAVVAGGKVQFYGRASLANSLTDMS
jgi:hypothetical protein